MTAAGTPAEGRSPEPPVQQVITPRPKAIADLSTRLAPRQTGSTNPSIHQPRMAPTGSSTPSRSADAQVLTAESANSPEAAQQSSPPANQLQARSSSAQSAAQPSVLSSTRSESLKSRRRRPNTVFYVSIDVSRQLREFARRYDKTNADVIFDALEANLDELPALLSSARHPSGDDDKVFARTQPKPIGQKVQLTGVVHDSNLAIIDRLVEQHDADSRSQLIEVALRAYLATDSVRAAAVPK